MNLVHIPILGWLELVIHYLRQWPRTMHEPIIRRKSTTVKQKTENFVTKDKKFWILIPGETMPSWSHQNWSIDPQAIIRPLINYKKKTHLNSSLQPQIYFVYRLVKRIYKQVICCNHVARRKFSNLHIVQNSIKRHLHTTISLHITWLTTRPAHGQFSLGKLLCLYMIYLFFCFQPYLWYPYIYIYIYRKS